MAKIETEDALRRIYNSPTGRTLTKQLDRLDSHCRTFISLSPFLVLSTVAANGLADASPRGGDPGFVKIEDDKTILLPDGIGNNRLDSLTNLLTNPAIGMVFFIPGIDEALRINGHAEIRSDDNLCALFEKKSHRPKTVLRITIKEAYLHCAKALMRARLWDPASQAPERPLPTMGQMIKDQTGDTTPVETQDAMLKRYRDLL